MNIKIFSFYLITPNLGLYKSYPFIDITRFRLFRVILPDSFKIYPTDKSEEILMRNCVKREILTNKKIHDVLFKKQN
jgi:hypothetical protein